jgi:hypothetical protein
MRQKLYHQAHTGEKKDGYDHVPDAAGKNHQSGFEIAYKKQNGSTSLLLALPSAVVM